jgi:hypothetical protein
MPRERATKPDKLQAFELMNEWLRAASRIAHEGQRMNLIFKARTVLAAAAMLAALTACQQKPDVQAKKYATVAEASKALDAESEIIDRLIVQLGQAKDPAEEKKLSCEQIPAHYAQMLAIMEANQHLMSDADQNVQQQFKQLAEQQKIRFESNLLCKSAH